MVKLTVVRKRSGDRILPAIYSDNYFTLLPGEQRTIQTEVNHTDTRGERPWMPVRGFNIEMAGLEPEMFADSRVSYQINFAPS